MPSNAQSPQIQIGVKVRALDHDDLGFGEIASYPDSEGIVEAHFYYSPVQKRAIRAPIDRFQFDNELPRQSRCYWFTEGVCLVGRSQRGESPGPGQPRIYEIHFPNNQVEFLPETEFHVRSYLPTKEPTLTLQERAHESPFAFEHRFAWVQEHVNQIRHCRGMTGLLSSRIELYPHQIEVVRRVLQDPEIRYLLADEVGLGKTIEAGVILRQLKLDHPSTRIGLFAPSPLMSQWRDELKQKFDLTDVVIQSHESLSKDNSFDVVILDEAHRLVATQSSSADQRTLFQQVTSLCHQARHLLLLSATPVLHHEEELLGLLHLLSPDAWPLNALDDLRQRLDLRRELGRLLLALPDAESRIALRRLLARAVEILPDDPTVQQCAPLIENRESTQESMREMADVLQVHLTETYRLHRRLLRTRRQTLEEQAWTATERKREMKLESCEAIDAVWEELESWRTIRVAESSGDSTKDIELYLSMAQTLASNREQLPALLNERGSEPISESEAESIARMQQLLNDVPETSRMDDLIRLLEKLSPKDQDAKYLVFCSESATCDWIAQRAAQRESELEVFTAHNGMSRTKQKERLQRFRDCDGDAVLLVDASMEEGYNFQFCTRLLFYDLPLEPMRIEQRIGRLDRLTRAEDIPCHVLLSSPDPELALDAAWFEILTKAFSILDRSLADLQLLIDQKMSDLRQIIFQGGPAALLRQKDAIIKAVEEERQEASEQDAIDGLHMKDLESTPLYRSLCEADDSTDAFVAAMNSYWKELLRLGVQPDRDRKRVVSYGRFRNKPPLLVADRFEDFKGIVDHPVTARRSASLEHQVPLLRPGHAFVDHLRALADWEDRGRAFAMWRKAPFQEPRSVFRICTLTGLELPLLEQAMKDADYDELSQAALLRLVNSWLPPRIDEIHLNEDGHPVPTELQNWCKDVYDSDVDLNLGGYRSIALLDHFGESQWVDICQHVRDSSLNLLAELPSLKQEQSEVERQATNHFQMVRSRMESRHRANLESELSLQQDLERLELLQNLVVEIIRNPRRRIDAIGLYLLSGAPPEINDPRANRE